MFFFDWVLLCHSNFFPRYYPETKDLVGPQVFGYNIKEHITHMVLFFPAAMLLAWVALRVF